MICSGKDILGGTEPNLLGSRQGICLFSGRPKGTTKTPLQGVQSDLFSSLPFVSPVSLGGGGDKNHIPKGHKNSLQNRVYPYR